MNHNRNLLSDLNELSQLQPDAAATEHAIAKTREALNALSVASSVQPNIVPFQKEKLMRPRNLVAIAAAVLLIVFASQWLPMHSSGNFAFAQVQEQVAKTKTVQYTETRTDRLEKSKSETKTKVTVLGASLERREMTHKELKLPNQDITFPLAMEPTGYITITDMKQGKIITLQPDNKSFALIRGVISITDDGKLKSEPVKADPKVDFYARIREVPADPMQRLPERKIDGKQAVGFVVEEKSNKPDGVDTFHRTYWIDVQTKLPVRLEATYRSTRPNTNETDWVSSDFVFDAPLDESLFSTNPPTGWTDMATQKPAKPDEKSGRGALNLTPSLPK